MIQKSTHAHRSNGITNIFLAWISFQQIDEILTLNVKIFSLIGIENISFSNKWLQLVVDPWCPQNF
jgi:sulfur transfer protein SufE